MRVRVRVRIRVRVRDGMGAGKSESVAKKQHQELRGASEGRKKWQGWYTHGDGTA